MSRGWPALIALGLVGACSPSLSSLEGARPGSHPAARPAPAAATPFQVTLSGPSPGGLDLRLYGDVSGQVAFPDQDSCTLGQAPGALPAWLGSFVFSLGGHQYLLTMTVLDYRAPGTFAVPAQPPGRRLVTNPTGLISFGLNGLPVARTAIAAPPSTFILESGLRSGSVNALLPSTAAGPGVQVLGRWYC